MLVNVGFSTPKLKDELLEPLQSQADVYGVEIVEITDPTSLFFSDQTLVPKVLTYVGEGSAFSLPHKDDSKYLCALLALHIERLKLEKMRESRHTLGNLIVILLSKIMKLERKIETADSESLNKLHQRFTALYEELEKINLLKL